jgi:hypothetical protein
MDGKDEKGSNDQQLRRSARKPSLSHAGLESKQSEFEAANDIAGLEMNACFVPTQILLTSSSSEHSSADSGRCPASSAKARKKKTYSR